MEASCFVVRRREPNGVKVCWFWSGREAPQSSVCKRGEISARSGGLTAEEELGLCGGLTGSFLLMETSVCRSQNQDLYGRIMTGCMKKSEH